MATLTNFSRGMMSWGVPVLPGPHVPFGPTSKAIFVAPYRTESNGASDGNDGLSPRRAVKTLSKALSLATANKNDVVFWISSGDSASETTDDLTATLDWNKDLVHLVGMSHNKYSQRCRMNVPTASGAVTPAFKVSASGCVFANFQNFTGGNAGNLVGTEVTGNHNTFYNIHFAGMGTTTIAGLANATSLKINGGSENVFRDCIIGLDTIERDGDSKGELWFDGGASRMWFEDCLITTYLSADNQSVTIEDGTAIDRTIVFKNCAFFAKSTNKATAQTTVFSIPAGISQGAIILQNSFAASDGGTVAWDTNNRGIIWNGMADPAVDGEGGIFVNR